MSGSDRSLLAPAIFGLVVCCFAGGIWLGADWTSQPSQQPQQHYASAKRYQASPSEREFAAYPVAESEACYSAKSHDSADLCAQWRAAVAAEKAADSAMWSNRLSIIGAVLTLIGLGFVYATFKETERTANAAVDGVAEAGRAADAATRAIDLSYKLERARISITDLVAIFTNEPDGRIGLRVSWTVKNTGRAPGFVIKVPLVKCFGTLPDIPSYPDADTDHSIYLAQDTGVYTNQFNTIADIIPNDVFDNLGADIIGFYVWGIVIYKDGVSNQQHSSGFLFQTQYEGDAFVTKMVPKGAYWSMT